MTQEHSEKESEMAGEILLFVMATGAAFFGAISALVVVFKVGVLASLVVGPCCAVLGALAMLPMGVWLGCVAIRKDRLRRAAKVAGEGVTSDRA